MKPRVFLAILSAAGCLWLSGCLGYHLGPAKPEFLKDVHTVAVPVFRNNTLLPGLDGMITDTVIAQIQQDGTYKVASLADADAVLTCTIEKVQRTPDRSVTGNVLLTSEFDLDLGVRYTLSERATGKILDSGRLDGQTSYFVGNDVQQDERQAVPLAAQQLAVRLVSAITEGF